MDRRLAPLLCAATAAVLLGIPVASAQSDVACGPVGPDETVSVLDTNRTYALIAGGALSADDYRVFEIDWGDGATSTLDNRGTDEDGARIGSTVFHAYEADGDYEVTVTLVEGASAGGACAPASAKWTVEIDGSGTSEVATTTAIGSGVAVDDARFEGRYEMASIVTGVQDPDGILGGGYGEGFIGRTYSISSSTAVPQCEVGTCDTTWDMFSTANPYLYGFDGTTYRKVLTWGEIPGGEGSRCPDDGIASIAEMQVVDAIVVGERTIATELAGVQQNYSRITTDCIPFATYSEAWSVRLTPASLTELVDEQAALLAAEEPEPTITGGPAPADDPVEEIAATPAQEDADAAARPSPVTSDERSNFAVSIPTWSDLPTDPADLASSVLIALALVVLIVFPSQLFNSTFSAHYDDIVQGTRRRVPWLFALFPIDDEEDDDGDEDPTEAAGGPFDGVVAKLAGAVAAAALLKAFLDPDVGFNQATLLTVLGFVSALAIFVVTATVIGLRLGRRLGRTDAYFKLLPGSLLIGLICVVISRSIGFLPGYLYVLVGSLAFREKLDAEGSARNAATTAVTLMAIGIVGWFALGPVADGIDTAADPGVGSLWLEATLAATFGVGIQAALFRMIPITFMAGFTVWTVSRRRWAAIYAPIVFLFVHIGGQREGDSSTVDWATTLSLFLLFGLTSVLFWAYWRNRDRADTAAAPPPVDAGQR